MCTYFFLIESPFYFFRIKDLLKTYQSLSRIAEINQEEKSVEKTKIILQEKLGLKGKNLTKLKNYQIKKLTDKKIPIVQNFI